MKRSLICLALMAAPALAQDLAARMDEYIASQVQARRFMGSVLVAQDGKVVLSKGYGMANLELDVPNRPETKHRLGSVTKQFVAAAMLQLEEQGKLSVQDPVCKHMPDCPAAWSGITIHHLLSHTSGIPNFTSFPDYRDTWMLRSRPEKTILRFKDKPLDFQPGERWSYSNSAYVLLGYLLERISGEKYEDYLRKHIFEPAGMADSGSDSHAAILKNRADGYSRGPGGQWVNSAYHDMTIPIGGGDLYSTVGDLLKWDQALAAGKLLSGASMQKMYTPVKNNYGYGWAIDKQYGRLRYGHGGGINGFATFISRFPEQKAVIAVLGNLEFANSGEIANNLAALLFGQKIVRPEDLKEVTLAPADLTGLPGEYELTPTFSIVVTVEEGRVYTQATGQAKVQIFPMAKDKFFLKVVEATIDFERGPDGKVTRLMLHQGGRDVPGKKK